MKLADVVDQMIPAARFVLAKGLDWQGAVDAFRLTLVREALILDGDSVAKVAQRLGLTRQSVSNLLQGRPGGRRPTKIRQEARANAEKQQLPDRREKLLEFEL